MLKSWVEEIFVQRENHRWERYEVSTQLSLIRYADGLVALHLSLEVIQQAREKIEQWLQPADRAKA